MAGSVRRSYIACAHHHNRAMKGPSMNKWASVATAAALVTAGSASVQAQVTLYGKVDLGVVHESGGDEGSVTKLSTGAKQPSRLGVKATFDVGDGLTAKGQFETGVCADSANNPEGEYCTGGTFMGRRATLALEGGFGEVSAGRQFTPGYLNVDAFDPFETGTAGQATNLFSFAGLRGNNSILYTTPSLGGFNGSVMYAFGEVPGDSSANRLISTSVGYSNGPLAAGVAYTERRAADSTATKDGSLGASYDFGMAKLYGLVQRTTGRDQYLLGTRIPAGAGAVLASYVRASDRSDAGDDASQIGIGYVRPINKILQAYAAYAQISNKNAAAYTVGNATDGGSGDRALNLGLILTF